MQISLLTCTSRIGGDEGDGHRCLSPVDVNVDVVLSVCTVLFFCSFSPLGTLRRRLPSTEKVNSGFKVPVFVFGLPDNSTTRSWGPSACTFVSFQMDLPMVGSERAVGGAISSGTGALRCFKRPK